MPQNYINKTFHLSSVPADNIQDISIRQNKDDCTKMAQNIQEKNDTQIIKM